jgi:hypothetical protein
MVPHTVRQMAHNVEANRRRAEQAAEKLEMHRKEAMAQLSLARTRLVSVRASEPLHAVQTLRGALTPRCPCHVCRMTR